jgi:hypothetical protein
MGNSGELKKGTDKMIWGIYGEQKLWVWRIDTVPWRGSEAWEGHMYCITGSAIAPYGTEEWRSFSSFKKGPRSVGERGSGLSHTAAHRQVAVVLGPH